MSSKQGDPPRPENEGERKIGLGISKHRDVSPSHCGRQNNL